MQLGVTDKNKQMSTVCHSVFQPTKYCLLDHFCHFLSSFSPVLLFHLVNMSWYFRAVFQMAPVFIGHGRGLESGELVICSRMKCRKCRRLSALLRMLWLESMYSLHWKIVLEVVLCVCVCVCVCVGERVREREREHSCMNAYISLSVIATVDPFF